MALDGPATSTEETLLRSRLKTAQESADRFRRERDDAREIARHVQVVFEASLITHERLDEIEGRLFRASPVHGAPDGREADDSSFLLHAWRDVRDLLELARGFQKVLSREGIE